MKFVNPNIRGNFIGNNRSMNQLCWAPYLVFYCLVTAKESLFFNKETQVKDFKAGANNDVLLNIKKWFVKHFMYKISDVEIDYGIELFLGECTEEKK